MNSYDIFALCLCCHALIHIITQQTMFFQFRPKFFTVKGKATKASQLWSCPGSPVLFVSESLTMVVSGNKVKL